MLCTISAVESNSVPSQSKTTRSKRRGRSVESVMGGESGERGDERGAFGRQRRDELEAGAGGGMVERELAGVQEHALEAHARHRLAAREAAVEGEVAVLVVADDHVPRMLQVDADLVRAAGLDRDVQQAWWRRTACAMRTSEIERWPSGWSSATG